MLQNEWQAEPELQNSHPPRKVIKRYPVPIFWKIFLPTTLILLLIFANRAAIMQEYITRFGVPVTGTIKTKDRIMSPGRKNSAGYDYLLKISYPVSNSVETTQTFQVPRWEYDSLSIGAPIKLMLHPKDPYSARIPSSKGGGVTFFLIEIIIFAVAFYGIKILRAKFNLHYRLAVRGQVVQGFIKTMNSQGVSVKVTVDYKYGGMYYENRKHALMYNPQGCYAGESVTLLVNPSNPEEFVVYKSCAYKVVP